MEEATTIEHRNLGYSWDYTLEVENVEAVPNTRASAKTTAKYHIGGNTETYEYALKQMRNAKSDLEVKQ